MSRTRKDRPYWVLKQDPKMDRYATHNHLVVLQELIGEEPVYRNVPDKHGWGWHEEVWYTRKLYRRTPVPVDCTLDIPEGPSHTWRRRARTNEERLDQKNCHWWLDYYPNVRSDKYYKQLTNGAVRSKVRQKLHEAVRDHGTNWNEDDWLDVDIFVDTKQVGNNWWNW